MWIAGGEKMEDISRLFFYFPQFHTDCDILIEKDIIKRLAFDQYEWTKSKTSLAEYFWWIGKDARKVRGGFWAPIEEVFKIDRSNLRRLAGHNANPLKPDESKDFKIIKEIVVQYRKSKKRQEEEAERLRAEEAKLQDDFKSVKKLIEETAEGNIESIRATMEKIKKIIKPIS